ncbi:MAG: 16S rRNA (uracil(1498)-N(3))-methyltransferase [Pyrinomonadaceae bacterium]
MTRRFFAPPANFQNSKIILDEDESRHLRDVLRLRAGARVNVFDGEGREFLAVAETIGKREIILSNAREIAPSAPESNLDLTLAVALLKGEKFDLVVQKACELGARKIIPLETKRADAKVKNARDDAKKLERWRRIALEAAKQSGRAKLMQVDAPISFESFVAERAETTILFAERDGQSFENFSSGNRQNIKKITAAVGAEGGWDDAEIKSARKNNFHIITLGGRILRAETAAITVSALLENHFGDLK